MGPNRTVEYFEAHFKAQAGDRYFGLNSFQEAALPHVSGRVLDLGCGLGGLSLAAARRGCEVVAVDASPTAIEHVSTVAAAEKLPLIAVKADIEGYQFPGTFDSVIAIGLLMFFARPVALDLLDRVQGAVRPEGTAAVTVLLEGTTFRDVLDGDRHYLFPRGELERAFSGWTTLFSRTSEFPARGGTVKHITSLVARKP